jgi:hypothetical protein
VFEVNLLTTQGLRRAQRVLVIFLNAQRAAGALEIISG